MKQNNFTLKIDVNPYGDDNAPYAPETPDGYVSMAHKQTYAIELTNYNSLSAEAEISIDGRMVGSYMLRKNSSFALEHPSKSNKKFTFLASNTPEAQTAQLGCIAKDKLGVVSVKFIPEKPKMPTIPFCVDDNLYRGDTKSLGASRGLSSGGTGLSGHSDQQFRTVAGLDRDENNTTTLELRLIHDSSIKQDIEPLHNRNTVVEAPPAL